MREYPELVGGTGVDDTRLMRTVDGLLVKGGADGVHCAALPDGRSIALKIADGSDQARIPVLVGALTVLGVGSARQRQLANCWTNSPSAPSWAAESPSARSRSSQIFSDHPGFVGESPKHCPQQRAVVRLPL